MPVFGGYPSGNMIKNITNTETSFGPMTWDDATWILTSSFIIFTMQSGFGLLEAGNVSAKNEVNIMVKNACDVVFGGLSYWAFGYAFTFGDNEWSNPFCGMGKFFVYSEDIEEMGLLYSNFIFQLSFATTATTIVSGAMAERTKLTSYILFSLANTLVYCLPAHWVWAENGFLKYLGVVDIAGAGAVHLLGGVSALVASMLLGPRLGRYDKLNKDSQGFQMGNPTNALVGMFMLWWGWLAFNSGSTYGISGGKWILASKACTVTICSSMGGGMVGIILSYARFRRYHIPDLINSVLGSLVGVTGVCAVVQTWEAVIIGTISGTLCQLAPTMLDFFHIDDPVGAVAVHGVGGLWGMVACGLFVRVDPIMDMTMGRSGLLWGGGFYLLGVQLLGCLCISVWSAMVTFLLLFGLKITLGIRLNETEELLGSDFVEHNIDHRLPDISTEMMRSFPSVRRRMFTAEEKTTEDNGKATSEAVDDVSEDNKEAAQRSSACRVTSLEQGNKTATLQVQKKIT